MGEDIRMPLDFLMANRANERVGPIRHHPRWLVHAQIVTAVADRAVNVFVEHEHKCGLS
jgi:hypothetical protein